MEKIISKMMWLLKRKNNLSNLINDLGGRDHKEFTEFLKKNPQFVNTAKNFHLWKESMLKADDPKFIEDPQAARGP